ncbi:MAG: hypothetical protein WAS33_16340 [Candidatus Promineifilaceae bacterium]
MPTTAIHKLKAHPAQMRSSYALEPLAALTLQIYERDLDDWQPIVASPNGEGFYIVSGHRRHMAKLLSLALQEWAAEHPETDITLETVHTMLNTLVSSLGSLEQVISSLQTKYGETEIHFVPFNGSQKAEILALQAANYGSDTPDMIGVAYSFLKAVEAGATPEEIARNSGQTLIFVKNHLALAKVAPELAQRIAAGELSLSIAPVVADLPEPQRSGFTIFILANEPGKLTAGSIKACAATLKKWPGLQMPLMVKHQTQRNMARALVYLWTQVLAAFPEDAYAAAAMLIYRQVHEEPWSNLEKLTLWFQVLGGDTYFSEQGIVWPAVVDHLITEVACTTCPIAQLPPQQLQTDLSQGQGGALGMPCRVGQSATRCIHGLAPNDSFDVRVPWEWSQHPGVTSDGTEYRVKSYEALLTAWQAQASQEQSETEAARLAAAAPLASEVKTNTAVQSQGNGRPNGTNTNVPDEAAIKSPHKAAPQSGAPAESPPAETNAPATPSPITKQRAQIALYMQQHELLGSNHPFATPCSRCRHRLESSPTKDETVPHCAWAGRQRNVSFRQLLPESQSGSPNGSKSGDRIPVCRQFAPSQPWSELLPAHPAPGGLPRNWLKAQILQLVKATNARHSGRNGFEFLTGRPMGANENYGDWFGQQFEAQSGELTDAQLFTLFLWAHTEWERASSRTFHLPVNGHSLQFLTVSERPFSIPA